MNNTTDTTTNTTTEETLTVPEAPKEVFGSYEVREVLKAFDTQIEIIDDVAGESLKAGDRKGVLLAMRVSSTLERARKSVKRSLDRANKVRGKKGTTVEVDIDDDDDIDIDE